jgi:hypothetical protein
MIEKNFEVAAISKKMDSSENDFLWQWSNEESCEEDVAQ